MSKERIFYFDNLKAALILLVVLGHALQFYESESFSIVFTLIYSFHMPLFIFVTGLFHKDSNIACRSVSMLLIYVFIKIIRFLNAAFILKQNAEFNLFEEGGVAWYAFAIAVYALVTYSIRSIDKKKILIMAVVIAAFTGLDSNIPSLPMRIITFYPFYLLGSIIKPYRIENYIKKMQKCRYLLSALYILLFISVFVCMKYVFKSADVTKWCKIANSLFFGSRSYPSQLTVYHRIIWYFVSSLLGAGFMLLIPTRQMKVSVIGTRTLPIYIYHRDFLRIFRMLDANVLHLSGKVGIICWLLFSVFLVFILSTKYVSYTISWMVNLKTSTTNKEIIGK